MNLDRPKVGIVTGIIYDEDTGIPANGLTVSIGDKTYTTDSYETLFKAYSDDPGQIYSGFYWIEGLTPGENVEVVFSSDGFETKLVEHTISSNPNGRTHENLNFLDVQLTSTGPPQFYPNPVSDGLKIEAGWIIEDLKIFSIKGQLVFTKKSFSEICSMNLVHLPPGIYLVRIRGENLTVSAKIIVKR